MNVLVTQAAQKLCNGEVVALPTETVYGLAADASNAAAVARIFELKNRPTSHPFILHIAPDADIRAFIDETRMTKDIWRMTRALMAAFFPGPLTLVLPKHPQVNPIITGGKDTIALRAPNHTAFQAVLREFARINNVPHAALAATSANLHGQPSPINAAQVKVTFDDLMVVDGGCSPIGLASTVLDLTTGVPMVGRLGSIGRADIERVVDRLSDL